MANPSSIKATAPESLPQMADTLKALPPPCRGAADATGGAPVPSGLEFFILGPRRLPESQEAGLWAVQARLLQWATDTHNTEDSWHSRACRLLYIDRTPAASPAPPFLLPGSFLARCRILTARITINGMSFDLMGPDTPAVDVDLLLFAEDVDWSGVVGALDDGVTADLTLAKAKLQQARCLAGEIPLAGFTVHPHMPSGAAVWQSRFETIAGQKVLDQVANAALSSSGLAFEANAVLPWSQPGHSIWRARYLAEVVLPVDAVAKTAELVVLPDLERLDDPPYRKARIDFLQSFADLASCLQPTVPPVSPPVTRKMPRWVNLGLADPTVLPDFAWYLDSDVGGQSPKASFRFGDGAWHLAVSDQPAGVAGVTPQGVMATKPILHVAYPATAAASSGAMTVTVTAPASTPPPSLDGSLLTYTLTQTGSGYGEQIDVIEADTAYDPVAMANSLRAIANLPAPDLEAAIAPSDGSRLGGTAGPASTDVVPQVLFGMLPLEEGWAQLPLLNVTDQILTDLLSRLPHTDIPATSSPFAGGVSFGTNRVGLFDPSSGEPAWAVNVLSAQDYQGTWTLQDRTLTGISLMLKTPTLALEGLFWLATAPPTPADALPTLDDFLGAITGFSLQTPSFADIYPSPFLMHFHKLSFTEMGLGTGYSSAAITALDFAYVANDRPIAPGQTMTVFDQMFDPKGPFDLTTIWENVPLVWRRHPLVPAIQSLPLTQSQTPPNTPCASRQLFPFTLPLSGNRPGGWRFQSSNGTTWPILQSPADPAMTDPEFDGLALLALGLPGLAFDPQLFRSPILPPDPANHNLPVQYRHEMALLDEVNALATLPRDDQAPDPGTPPPAPPPGLRREDYDAFWRQQADLAFFATAEARDALIFAGTQLVVRGLIEPFDWPVAVTLAVAPYPGTLKFVDSSTNTQTLTLNGEGTNDALRGLQGTFQQSGAGEMKMVDTASAQFTVVGEAMAAALNSTTHQIRDQRGLYREATQLGANGMSNWLTTRVGLLDDPMPVKVILWTALAPLPLSITSTVAWNFWLRDLPAIDSGTSSAFARSTCASAQRKDENDPAAANRLYNHLNGYEWRLGAPVSGKPDQSPLPIGSLWFYPLSLEAATFRPAHGLVAVSMIGRLHLPLPGVPLVEPVDRSNAVLVTFANGALSAIALAAPDYDGPTPSGAPPAFNDWPLADPTTHADAPIFRWTAIRLEGADIVVSGQVVYVRHGVSWTLPSLDLKLPLDSSTPAPVTVSFTVPADAVVALVSGTLALNFSTMPAHPIGHSFTLRWQFAWGKSTQIRLLAIYDEPVLAPVRPGGSVAPIALTASLAVQSSQSIFLTLDTTNALQPNLEGGAIQLQWMSINGDASAFQMLPGLHLSGDADRASRGFAALSFEFTDQPGSLPLVDQPQGGYVEALFGCDWSNCLQMPLPTTPSIGADGAAQRIFGSSAGKIDAAYTLTVTAKGAPAAPPQLLLNGFVEVKDLASWPTNLVPDPNSNLVTVPAVGTTTALNHIRHTARILFQQYRIALDPTNPIFVPCAAPGVLLTVAPNHCWNVTAVVEHQFIAVNFDGSIPITAQPTTHDVRLTMVQEVRFCAPSAFRAMLDEMGNQATVDMKFPLAGVLPDGQSANSRIRFVPGVARAYLSQPMIARFQAGPAGTVVDLTDGDGTQESPPALIVEASFPALIRTDSAILGQPSSLAYLPIGTLQAYLASLSDYQSPEADPRTAPTSWTLVPITFLGRLQPISADGVPPATPAHAPADSTQPSTFRIDPVLEIAIGRAAGYTTLGTVALTMANWTEGQDVSIGLAEYDLPQRHRFTRLDPSSLSESWFRLQQSPPSQSTLTRQDGQVPAIDTVLAAPPMDVVAALGRPEVLARVLDVRRLALPPDAANQPSAAPLVNGPTILWYPDGLFVSDIAGSVLTGGQPGLSGTTVANYGFLGVCAQIAMALMVPAATAISRRPAATVLRIPRLSRPDTMQPVSIAVSPYLGLGLLPTSSAMRLATPVLVVSELVCFDVNRQDLISVGSRIWNSTAITPSFLTYIQAWGREIQSRMAADSPVAVIRIRELHVDPAPAPNAPVAVSVVYRFLSTDQIIPLPAPARRAPALRAQPAALRHAQGQYGGCLPPPDNLAPFEVAPPQVIGVQPLRLDKRPGTADSNHWPWGLSAYRFSMLHTAGGAGIAGPLLSLPDIPSDQMLFAGRLWWSSLHHAVQYKVPDPETGRLILPPLFRAEAMPGLLPTWPSSPLPLAQDVKAALQASDNTPPGTVAPPAPPALAGWQPVLPGAQTMLIAGARPGAPFAFRSSLQTQSLQDNRSVVGGSVPVMHRMPRPLLLPPNNSAQPDIALQTAAGAFNLPQTVMATTSPADSAYLAAGPVGLDLVLQSDDPATLGKSIRGGIIASGPVDTPASRWDGTLRFQGDGHGIPLSSWFHDSVVSLEAIDPRTGKVFTFSFGPSASSFPAGEYWLDPANPSQLNSWLTGTQHGDSATVRVSVGNDPPGDVQNFRQMLSFPLRVAYDQGLEALPYQPSFLLFEDPQYSRRLASITAQQTGIVAVQIGSSSPLTYSITLSADRHEYNPTGQIHYLFYSDPSLPTGAVMGDFTFTIIRRDGSTTTLPSTVNSVLPDTLPSTANQDLATLIPASSPLKPGDTLILTLNLVPATASVTLGGTTVLSLSLPIVAAPVTPVPEAGYALLRRNVLLPNDPNPDADPIECVRFAFSPEATRIELVDPNDLRRQNVRRRAVFLWRDTTRIGRTYSYAIQKITTGGATHFPVVPKSL